MHRFRFTMMTILTIWLMYLYSSPAIYAQNSSMSQLVTWTCSGSPCPWGEVASGEAIVWPAVLGPISQRLGYTTSAGVYLPAGAATGMGIAITAGTATVYAGQPNTMSHHILATLSAGQSYLVTDMAADEVVSVQGANPFVYTLTMPSAATATPTSIAVSPTPTMPSAATATPTPIAASPTPTPTACVDPLTCNPVSSIPAFWRCNIPGCTYSDWIASAISWPAWSAYADNARSGDQSRTVYSAAGEKLYPYMDAWANGCQVTAVSGRVLIIEWQRGTDIWRETYLTPGQTYTISLIPPEDGALIETQIDDPLISVSLANCTPQPVSATATPTSIAASPTPTACVDPLTCNPVSSTSQLVTWTCSGSPCPWGEVASGEAIVWPAVLGPISQRLGYTTSAGVYLPAGAATGMGIAITAGTATVYAGQPNTMSHHILATLSAGQSYLVTDMAADEVVSVQGANPFVYTLTMPSAATATPTSIAVSPTPTLTACVDPLTCNPVSSTSQLVTWTCSGSPCPWGEVASGQAIVWPAMLGPISQRLGYTTSAGVYLPASAAAGMGIAITAGTATVYAGQPNAISHHILATLSDGQSYLVTDMAADEVVSVQSSQALTYDLIIPVSAAMSDTVGASTHTEKIMTSQVFLPLISADRSSLSPDGFDQSVWELNPECPFTCK